MVRLFGRRNGNQFIPALLLAFPVFFFIFLLLSSGHDIPQDDHMKLENRLSEIQSHMEHLRFLDKEKSKSLITLRSQLNHLLTGNRSGSAFDAPSWLSWPSNLSSLNHSLFKNGLIANFSSVNIDLAIPNGYDHLPHLLRKAGTLTPAIRISAKNRRNLHTVIGIPTIKRPKVSYIVSTLRSLIDNLSPEHASQVLIVVFLADIKGTQSEFVQEQLVLLQSEFPTALRQGLLEILVPPPDFYPPDMDRVPPTFDDLPERMYWRTKQNLDYAYMMMYCQQKGRYYMQLEDDVITKPNYMETVKEFITKNSGTPWFMLEYSSLGFIGKLFKSADLHLLVEFLLMFYREKPVDWLLDHIFFVRFCHPEKSPKQCQQVVRTKYRLRYKPSLFQHIGTHSSLAGKVQKLKEKDFGKQPMHKTHLDNPPANVSTSLKPYQKYTLDKSYKGETFFWGLLPQVNDWLRFDFNPPVRIEGFIIRSGNAEHPDDKFTNTSVELRVDGSTVHHLEIDESLSSYPLTIDNYYIVGSFSAAGTAQASINTTRTINSLRLVVHTESVNWVILNEIWVRSIKD